MTLFHIILSCYILLPHLPVCFTFIFNKLFLTWQHIVVMYALCRFSLSLAWKFMLLRFTKKIKIKIKISALSDDMLYKLCEVFSNSANSNKNKKIVKQSNLWSKMIWRTQKVLQSQIGKNDHWNKKNNINKQNKKINGKGNDDNGSEFKQKIKELMEKEMMMMDQMNFLMLASNMMRNQTMIL